MVFALILIAFCIFLLFLCGDFAGIGTLLAFFGGFFVLFVVYVGVRSAIDPEYEKRIKREAADERRKEMLKKRQELLDSGHVFTWNDDDDNYHVPAIL